MSKSEVGEVLALDVGGAVAAQLMEGTPFLVGTGSIHALRLH